MGLHKSHGVAPGGAANRSLWTNSGHIRVFLYRLFFHTTTAEFCAKTAWATKPFQFADPWYTALSTWPVSSGHVGKSTTQLGEGCHTGDHTYER